MINIIVHKKEMKEMVKNTAFYFKFDNVQFLNQTLI